MNEFELMARWVTGLDGGEFQSLVADYVRVSGGYERFVYRGQEAGTHNTVAGTPDAYYIDREGSQVFLEVGFRKRARDAARKLEEDARKCLAYEEERNVKAARIVLCTSNAHIDPDEYRRIAGLDPRIRILTFDELCIGLCWSSCHCFTAWWTTSEQRAGN